MKHFLTLLLLLLTCHTSFSQADSLPKKIYHVNLKYELPAAALMMGASYFGYKELDRVATFDADDIAKLNASSINGFDRPTAFNNPANFAQAQKNSDLFLNISIISPAVLLIDKRIRKDWLELLTLYMAAHSVDNAIYFATAFSVRRARPFTYNPEVSIGEKTGVAKSNSLFSGHVSFSATSTFFLAKVYTDYHRIKGWKRLLVFTAAAVPPALVGYFRVRSGRHFRSDVMLGFVVGASSGILVPELHRRWKKNDKLTIQPFYAPGYGGLSLNLKL
jgi:membrane-associated phospholipid phosphatase